jgi:eukaryotic-like serine/threonine-protein kinase
MPATVPGLLCPACALSGALATGKGPTVSRPDSHPSVVRPGSRFGDYELLAEIARGGMGVLYRARQISLNRIVAVKWIRPERLARPADVRRFQFEAVAAAQLRHPNIVAVHEAGEWEGQPYFSMEFVEGRSLAETVREQALSPFLNCAVSRIQAGSIASL